MSGQKIFTGIDLEGLYVNLDLSNLLFEDCYIVADFTGSNLSKTAFKNCNLKTCIFCYSNINQAVFDSNSLEATDFRYVQYNELTLLRNTCYDSFFNKEDLENAREANYPGFHIIRVYAGWFEVVLIDRSKAFVVTASDYLGNDAPKEIIDVLCELCKLDSNEIHEDKWLCWDEEPGAYLWKITRHNENLKIVVYGAKRDSWDISLTDRDSLKNEEITEIYIDIEGDFIGFIKEVIKSFQKISDAIGISKYENEWGIYPSEELKELKELVKQLQKQK